MNKKPFLLLCLVSIAYCQLVSAQQSGTASLSSPDTNRIDTNYIRFYEDKLIIGLYQSERSFNVQIDQKIAQDTSKTGINYIANSNHVSGISLDYDIIGFAFGYKSIPSGNSRTGNSDYLDFGLNINTRSLRFENSFKRYSGFYDNNTVNYIHPFTDSTPYYQNPHLSIRVIKSKLLYTFNKRKFALGAAYANVKRQVRSKGSWLVVGNFYALNMFSDSSVIPLPLRPHYGVIWDGLNRMNIYAYSVGFGGSYTVVFWKNFNLNVLASYGLEAQYRHFYTNDADTPPSKWVVQSAGDWRASFGYNAKRFFMRVSTIQDINNYDTKGIKFGMKFIAGSFDFGYRFNFKAPKPYRKFQESKLYKML
jgi:hypothetical protein